MKKQNRKKRNIILRILKYLLYTFLTFLGVFIIYFFIAVKTNPPAIDDLSALNEKVVKIENNLYGIKNNRFRKSNSGLWELYIEGKAFDRGVYNGKLTKKLVIKQEDAFVEQIKKMIPSDSYLKFLKYFVGWFNRNMDKYISYEYISEIFGVSYSASDDYEFIGTNYHRILNYHGAHDIGHALQDMAMVGCTSFSVWDEGNKHNSLIIGRNFDFYVGDKFAEDKIVAFYNPEKGNKFAMITWGGFIGVVSGMNDKGLTVTLNAGKSKIPMSAKVPISLLAREILQYAQNIEQAYKIAKSREIFVSEALMIGSAEDNKTAVIEKSPYKTAIFYADGNSIIGPNHFQSKEFENEELNKTNIRESSSMYRYNRMRELIDKQDTVNYQIAADILRDKKGLNNKNIGFSNEKSICQLISHHSIIFKPDDLKFWISTSPFQLGEYICYDMKNVFAIFPGMKKDKEIYEEEYTIKKDTFVVSNDYKRFKNYKKLSVQIQEIIKSENELKFNKNLIEKIILSNPEYYYVYELSGDYLFKFGKYKESQKYYETALLKEVATMTSKRKIKNKIKEIDELLAEKKL